MLHVFMLIMYNIIILAKIKYREIFPCHNLLSLVNSWLHNSPFYQVSKIGLST
jgi:hypothetical protein